MANGMSGIHSIHDGSASARIWSGCDLAVIWMRTSRNSQSSAPK